MSGGETEPTIDDADSPIEGYLDCLLTELLPGSPRHVRHLLAETEAHLRDAAADAASRGLTDSEAEREAVELFGPAAQLAGEERRRRPTPLRALARQFLSSGLLLGAVGGLAVGASGVLAAGLWVVGGSRFIIDVAPGRTLAASDCARWLAGYPRAHSCAQAAIADWAYETVGYRLVVGVLGAVAMMMFVALRRRWTRAHRWTALPSTVVDTLATTLFGLSGVWLLGLGIDAVVVNAGHGAGQWLSAAPVAMMMTAVFCMRLVHDLRHDPHPRTPRASPELAAS